MITNYDQALEQNKVLVEESFRIHQLYSQSQSEIRQLKEQLFNLRSLGPTGESDLMKKLTIAEAQFKEKEEMCMRLLRSHQLIENKFAEADRRAKELQTKLGTPLYEVKASGFNNVENISAQRDEKAKELILANKEMETIAKLLENAHNTIVTLNKERNLLFVHYQKLKAESQQQQTLDEQVKIAKEFNLVAKEKKLDEVLADNKKLVAMVYSLESENKEMLMKLRSLQMELEGCRSASSNVSPYQQPISGPMYQTSMNNQLMSQMMQNIEQMQLEIQQLNQQRSLQDNGK